MTRAINTSPIHVANSAIRIQVLTPAVTLLWRNPNTDMNHGTQ